MLILLAFLRLGLTIYSQKETFFSRGHNADFEQYKRYYYSSQYVQKKNPSIIPDTFLEVFAAGAFLRGMNPILIIHDHPPLGRYIVASSLLLFDNPYIVMIIIIGLTLYGLFLIANTIFNNAVISLLPIALFANEPLLLNKLTNSPLLEPIQFVFIVFAFYFFILGVSKKNYTKYFILTSLMIGFVISTRFFITGAAMVFGMVSYFILQREINKKFFIFLFSLPIAVIVLLLSYTRTMMDGYNVIKILGIQKYILVYHKSKFILPFTYWDLLLFNKWHTWWGDRTITTDPHWMITWPLAIVFTLGNLLYGMVKKIPFQPGEKILFIWIGIYSIMLSTGYTSTNYFLPVIPFIYILTTAFFVKIIKTTKGKFYKNEK